MVGGRSIVTVILGISVLDIMATAPSAVALTENRTMDTFSLEHLPVPVLVGPTGGATAAHASMRKMGLDLWELDSNALPTNVRTVDWLQYLVQAAVAFVQQAPPSAALYLSDPTGTGWASVVAVGLLKHLLQVPFHKAEVLVRTAACPRRVMAEPTDLAVLVQVVTKDRQPVSPNPSVLTLLRRVKPSKVPLPIMAPARLPRHPNLRLRCMGTFGDVAQFSMPLYRPSGWSCGSISLYAALMSEWLYLRSWQSKEVTSVVLNGLWHARRYPNQQVGFDPIELQVQRLCPEFGYRTYDLTDSTDGTVEWCRKLAPVVADVHEARFVLTAVHLPMTEGHYNFVAYQHGYWYWLESLHCDPHTLCPGSAAGRRTHDSAFRSGGGPVLRTFDSLDDIAAFAERILQNHRWSLTQLYNTSCQAPFQDDRFARPVIYGCVSPGDITVPEQPLIIEQDIRTHQWLATATVHPGDGINPLTLSLPAPLQIVSQPHFMVVANLCLCPGTLIHLAGAEWCEHMDSGHRAVHEKQYLQQSPFLDPAFYVTRTKHSIMVGHHGAWIVPYMRRLKNACKSNTCWQQGKSGVYLMVTQRIEAGHELYHPGK